MRIVADTGKCVGAGQCVRVAPELFDQDEDAGTVVVLDAEPDGVLLSAADEAADLCPVRALSVAG